VEMPQPKFTGLCLGTPRVGRKKRGLRTLIFQKRFWRFFGWREVYSGYVGGSAGSNGSRDARATSDQQQTQDDRMAIRTLESAFGIISRPDAHTDR
jgi:hypothetical protein